MTIDTANIASLTMELQINANTEDVWEALTRNIGEWWPAEFFAGGEAGAREFSLQPIPGGLMQETWNNGGGVLWGTVVAVDPARQLQILGSLFPSWGGPTQWFGSWDLEAHKGGTRLRFSEHALGKVSEKGTAEKDHGWRFLIANLKAFVENEAPPVWAD